MQEAEGFENSDLKGDDDQPFFIFASTKEEHYLRDPNRPAPLMQDAIQTFLVPRKGRQIPLAGTSNTLPAHQPLAPHFGTLGHVWCSYSLVAFKCAHLHAASGNTSVLHI